MTAAVSQKVNDRAHRSIPKHNRRQFRVGTGKVSEKDASAASCDVCFRFTYKEASSWGVRLPNGSWTGSMRMLIDDEADLAAAELMMTSDRVGTVEFTTPVYSTK